MLCAHARGGRGHCRTVRAWQIRFQRTSAAWTGACARGYDRAFVLPNSFKSAIMPFAARIPRRTGFVGELRYVLLNDARKLDKAKPPRTVDRFIALGLDVGEMLPAEIPHPQLRADAAGARALARLGHERPKAPVLGLCPGAEYGPAKRWPAEYFAEVANARLADGLGGVAVRFGQGRRRHARRTGGHARTAVSTSPAKRR